MDIEALKQAIQEEIQNETMEELAPSDDGLNVYDMKDGRYITFHTVPPTEEWLKTKFIYGPSCKNAQTRFEKTCIDILLNIDPNMLVTLNRIIFINGECDIPCICQQMNCDTEWFPEAIDMETHETLGCYWYQMNSIIIDVKGIVDVVLDIAKESPVYVNIASEIDIGVYTTLLHEIRHLGLSNPFLPEDDYPSELGSEENIEQWAIDTYEEYTGF